MATPRARGFTLIELLVVVVIISLIAAVMIPALLRQMQRQRREAPAAGPHLSQSAPSAIAAADGPGGPGSEEARLAHIESTDVRVDLRARQLLAGGAVHTEYDAAFQGTFTIRSGAPRAGVLTFRFPFPPGISEARDVSLRVQRPGGVLVDPEPEEVSYQREGIRWSA
jgi:prepilin-type N-terminal cleavage/methylation domain-containing protein